MQLWRRAVQVAQVMDKGGPAVRAAAQAVLSGPPTRLRRRPATPTECWARSAERAAAPSSSRSSRSSPATARAHGS
ncbi:ALF repeat-containing protein [Streptomyces anulatus]